MAPPGREELLDCTREEVRRLYQERHRFFFGVPEFGALLASLPCYPILDDHEIHDNIGSAPEHATARWRALREGARDAFFDYQASRVLERPGPSFHYGFSQGPVAVFVMDVRSERIADDETMNVFGDAQLRDLKDFLLAHASSPVVAIVVSVPLAYITSDTVRKLLVFGGQSSDAADRWSNPKALRSRTMLLGALRAHQRAHPNQRLILLSGDIHVGSLLRIDWPDGLPPAHQFTSSAISNLQPRVAQWAAEQIPRVLPKFADPDELEAAVAIVPGVGGADENPDRKSTRLNSSH